MRTFFLVILLMAVIAFLAFFGSLFLYVFVQIITNYGG